ncbi:TcfC E-set like domain-containing protein [Serratia inhibens]
MYIRSLLTFCISSTLMAPAFSRGLDVSAMPAEFRRYFFDTPVPARVMLNDEYIFDGTFILKEEGQIRLKAVLDSAGEAAATAEQVSKWESVLREGITLGDCAATCPEGLVTTEYLLERSELKMYTRQYEQNRVASNYISLPETLPSGLIISNDLTASGRNSRFDDWRLNSSWLSSLFGWTQKLMLQSAYSQASSGYRTTEIAEAWSQKELEGSYLRTGVFSSDTESGNVQMPGYASDRIAGAMWGTSDTLLNAGDSVSLYPVYVTGRNQSLADVFINEKLVYTQQLRAGIQALDTRRLPGGVYDISIRISENGKVTDVQTAQVYKPARWGNADKRWRASVWVGQALQAGPYSASQGGEAYGFRADVLLHPRSTGGLAFARNAQEQLWSIKNETQITDTTTLYSRYTLWQDGRRDSDIRLFRTLGAGNASAGWRHGVVSNNNSRHRKAYSKTSDIYSGSFSWQFPGRLSLTVGGQYTDSGYRRGLSSDLSLRKTASLWSRTTELRLSAYQRPSWSSGRRDTGVEIGMSIPLFSDSRVHNASAEMGTKDSRGYANLSYNWRPEEPGALSYLGATTSLSRSSHAAGVNGGLESRYASGDFYTQTTRGSGGLYTGVNLNNTLAVGGGKVAAASHLRDTDAAVIVDVDSHQDDPGVTVVSPAGDVALKKGRNLVSADVWQRRTLQFDGNSTQNMHVYPASYSFQMNRGSVGYASVRAVRKKTVIALLTGVDGAPLLNRETASDIAQAQVNSDGVVTIDVSAEAKQLSVAAGHNAAAMTCTLPDLSGERRETVFINRLVCTDKDKT